MADDEYTPEQKQKIARHFLFVTPHGEVNDIINDLKKVVKPASIISDSWLKECMSEYNKRRFEIVSGDSSKVVCCPQAEVEPNKYLHPDKKLVCTVDPVTQKIVSEADAAKLVGTGQNEEFRSAINGKLQEYLKAHYQDGTNPNSYAKGTGMVYASPQGKVAIVISYKNLNLNSYWTGGWQSEWTLNVNKQGTTKLGGRIRINVHYFEDGNVQLNSTFQEQGEVDVTDPSSTAEAVMNTVKTLENDFQKKLDQFYVQMHDSTFKNMRRFLPKTGTRVDWRARVHSLVSEAASK